MSDLTRALVGSRGSLYVTSPQFKASIDLLAQMLPLWVDGIAEHAEQTDRAFAARLQDVVLRMPTLAQSLDLTTDAVRDVGVTAWRDQ